MNPQVSCNRENVQRSIVLHSILPVEVDSQDSGKSVIAYAFTDSSSSGDIATENLRKQLGLEEVSTTLHSGTVHGNSLKQSSILKG